MSERKEEVFSKRMILYRLQYILAPILSLAIWYGVFVFFCYLSAFHNVSDHFHEECLLEAPLYIVVFFNMITYIWSRFLAKKYGIGLFSDFDQEWLKGHSGFSAKDFGIVLEKRIERYQWLGPYLFPVIVLALVRMWLGLIAGIVFYVLYRYHHTRMSFFKGSCRRSSHESHSPHTNLNPTAFQQVDEYNVHHDYGASQGRAPNVPSSPNAFPQPGEGNFDMGKAQIPGTHESNVTGGSFVPNSPPYNPFGDH